MAEENQIAGLNSGESGLDAELETAEANLAVVDDKVGRLARELHDAERRQSALLARREALEVGVDNRDGAGALLAASDEISGLLGSVAALLTVRAGHEAAIAAALGSAADAVAVDHLDTAVVAMEKLKAEDWGRAGILLGAASAGGLEGVDDSTWPGLPDFATYAVDVVDGPDALGAALRRVLFKVAVVDDLKAAEKLVKSVPDVTAVTLAGDILGPHFAVGGSQSQAASLIEVRAAIEQAAADLDRATADVESLRFQQQGAEAERHTAQHSVDAALARLHESDAEMAAVAERLGHFGSTVRAARAEADRLAEAIAAAEVARDRDLAGLAELEERLAQAEAAPDVEPDAERLEELSTLAAEARRAETEALLALRTNEERERALRTQAQSLRDAAAAERQARVRDQERRERQQREAQAAQAVVAVVNVVLSRMVGAIDAAAQRRTEIEAARTEREEALRQARGALRELGVELDSLTDSVHKDEIQRAELRLRMEALEAKSLEDLGIEVEALVADYGPENLIPFLGEVEGDEPRDDAPYDREAQTKRLRSAERAMAMLGKVNPLALEEFSALEERHQFLSEQIDDLRRTRKDLLDIVDDVDAKVLEVFTAAWLDVEAVFRDVFSRLFPGGEGRLILTDPDDLLNTGIEVEARPPGKKVKRLSLLSGGERSLVAVAFLVSLFKARPSPFYILDEVEAALDDTNLGRLLEIYEELRDSSQLIVITHQKRTMEVADALYGVSMRGDGVTSVISQRLRDEVSA